MLFRAATIAGIESGAVTVAFRRWKRPTVKTGGTLRTQAGVLAIESVEEISEKGIRPADIKRAGFEDRDALLASLRDNGEPLYRIQFHLAGEDPRIQLRENDELSAKELQTIKEKLSRLDQRSAQGAWTKSVLKVIAKNPGKRAPDLAAGFGRETLPFKRDVRKLKELGLTESLEVGYRLSPRGKKVLAALEHTIGP
jgi:hypothetical protein